LSRADPDRSTTEQAMPTQNFLTHWYFHVPNLILAVLMYALIARYLVSLVLPAGNVIVRILGAVTNPIVRSVAAITPRIVPPSLVILFGIGWLIAVRMALFFGFALAGVRVRL
jgi:YggT family protein